MRRCSGFTLLELLIALTIFALISVMAYSGMNSVMAQRAQTEERAERLKQLQMLFNLMERDFSQLIDRPVRDQYGNELEALASSFGVEAGVEITRTGYANPAGLPRSELQRVRYRLEDGALLREVWWVLDRAPDTEPVEQPLLEDIGDFSMRFLDQTDVWRESWPPSGAGVSGPPGMPRAVEISIDVKGVGELVWLVRLAESPTFAMQSLRGPGPVSAIH